jgi:uncharacterized protein
MNGVRVQEADVLRGFALFGICVVNLPFLAAPMADMLTPPALLTDRIASFIVELLFQGKFFVLFSFLFGWGFGAQLASAERGGRQALPYYARRLLGLLLIGVAHAVLVFHGDILVLYAILGALLWPLRSLSIRSLLIISGALLTLGFCALFLLAAAISAAEPISAPAAALTYLGSYSDGVRQRILDWQEAFVFVAIFNGPLALAAFCAGLAAFRTKFFEAGSSSYARFMRALPWIAAPALIGNFIYALSVNGALGEGWAAALGFSGLAFAGPCLAALYLAGFVSAARRSRHTDWIARMGRMSLTAYVGEGVIAGFIFNGYGLALYGSLGALALLGVAVLVYLAAHWLCSLWLLHRSAGPLESVLRLITRGAVV